MAWVVYDNAGRGDGIGSRYFTVFNAGGGVAAQESSLWVAAHDVAKEIEIEEVERIQMDVGAVRGYMLLNGERRPLPIGSTLVDGVFYWQPGPGFLGTFQLVFERPGSPDAGVAVRIHAKRFHSNSQ